MPSITLDIINQLGLHARAAEKLTHTAEKFSSTISVSKDDIQINAKSIMQVMMLAAGKGSEITIHAEGDDAEEALAALAELINNYFDEGE